MGQKKKWVKRGYFNSLKNSKIIYYASSLELETLRILESQPDVIGFGRCKFSIEYSFGNIIKRYIPDFYVHYLNSEVSILEVKPEGDWFNKFITQGKMNALSDYCSKNNYSGKVYVFRGGKRYACVAATRTT